MAETDQTKKPAPEQGQSEGGNNTRDTHAKKEPGPNLDPHQPEGNGGTNQPAVFPPHN